MRRLIVVGILVTVLLIAFAGSALADGPYGYNTGYNTGYWQNHGYAKHGGQQWYPYYPTYNYCCVYVYNPCPYTNYGYPQQNYSYGGYNMNGNYGQYANYGW